MRRSALGGFQYRDRALLILALMRNGYMQRRLFS